MSVFFEVSIPNGGSAFIDAGLVRGCAKHKDLDAWDDAPPGKPLTIFFGDGRELEALGISAMTFLVMCHEARERSRSHDGLTVVGRDDWVHRTVKVPGGFDIQIRYSLGAQAGQPLTPQP